MGTNLEKVDVTEFPFILKNENGQGDLRREGYSLHLSLSDVIKEVEDHKTLPASQIAHMYSHLYRVFQQLDELRDEMSKQVEFVKTVLLPQAFENEALSSFTLEDGTRVTVSEKINASIPPHVKEEAYQWLVDHNLGALITQTVNASSLSSTAKGILAGEVEGVFDLPSELFNVSTRKTTSVTRRK